MARNQQDILVKIRILLEGLGNVRALAGHIKELNAGGGHGGGVVALAGDIDKLSTAVDRLATSQEKASSKGGFVRFLVGVSAVVNTLATIPQALQGINKLLDFFDSLGGSIGAVVGKVKDFGSSLFSSVSSFASGAGAQAGAALSSLGGAAAGIGAALAAALPFIAAAAAALALLLAAVTPLIIAFTGLAGAAALGLAALFKIGPAGVQLNSQLEQVRLGIAAVITSLAELKAGDVPLEGAEKFRTALVLAADQVRKLRVDAIQTTATFEQIAPAFQAAIGPALAAGLTLDQIRETTVKIVQAASAIGLPLEQVNQEVRAILEGTINEDARLAKIIGLTPKMVKDFKAAGTLVDELNKRLEGFAVAGEEAANSLDGLQSNLQEALNVFNQEATTRAFGALKEEFKRLLPQLFDFKSAGIAAQFQTLAQLADDVLVRVIRIGGSIAQSIVSGLKRAGEFAEQNRGTIDNILTLVEMVVRQLLQGVGVIARLATDTGTWKGLLTVVQGTLALINILLGAMVDKLREAEPLLRLAALAGAVLLASSPTIAAFAGASSGAKSQEQIAAEVKAQTSAGIDALQVALTNTKASRPAAAGGGKTKAAKRDQLRDLTAAAEDAQLGTDRARVERAFNLAKDFLERQSRLVEEKLADRLLTIEQYYVDEERIQREAIDAEVTKLNELYALQEEDLRRKKARIDADPDKDLSAAEREQKKAAADEEFRQAVIPTVERLTVLDRERLDLADQIARKRRDELKTFQQMLDEVNESLALETGDTDGAIEAARSRIDAANKERLERIARQKGADSTEYQQAVQLVEVLKKKAEYQLLYNQLRQQQEALQFAEDRIRADVERGLIGEKVGREQVIAAQLKHKEAVAETVRKMQELADESGDPELTLDAERAAEGMKDLGRVIDEEGVRINRSLRDAAEGTLFDILRNPQDAMSAVSRLVNHILDELARLASAAIIEQLFGENGILGGIFGNKGGGGIGGILSGIFGKRPAAGQQTGGAGGIDNLPGIIKNFQSGAVSNLTGIKGNTFGALGELRNGFNGVQSKFQEVISFLPNLLPAGTSLLRDLVAKGIEFAGSIVLKKVAQPKPGGGVKSPLGGSAEGGLITGPGTGTSDSIAALLSNGEYVIRAAAVRMVGPDVLHFLNTFGRLPTLVEPPRFAFGGPVGAIALEDINPVEQTGGDTYNVKVNATIQTTTPQAFRGSEAEIHRKLSRATMDGIRRAKSRPRG